MVEPLIGSSEPTNKAKVIGDGDIVAMVAKAEIKAMQSKDKDDEESQDDE